MSEKYELTGQLGRLVDAAMDGEDKIEIMTLGGPGSESEVSIAVVKGAGTIDSFRSWAHYRGFCVPGRTNNTVLAVETIVDDEEDRWLGEIASTCRSCSACSQVPCGGCCQGGMCDELCHCSDR